MIRYSTGEVAAKERGRDECEWDQVARLGDGILNGRRSAAERPAEVSPPGVVSAWVAPKLLGELRHTT